MAAPIRRGGWRALLDGLSLRRPVGARAFLRRRRGGRTCAHASRTARRPRPGRRRLALPPEGGAAPKDPAWLQGALAPEWVRRALVDAVLVNPWLTRRLLAGLLARPQAASGDVVATLQRPYRRPGTSAAYAEWLPSLLLRDRDARSADPAAYRGLALPVALVWGEDDRVTPIAQGERLRALIPGATLDALPGVGHIPHIEDEAAFVAAAVRRLADIEARMNGL